MNAARKRLFLALSQIRPSRSVSSLTHGGAAATRPLARGTLTLPWSAIPTRGVKLLGTDVRVGNVLQRKGHIYQVVKAQHTTQGRGGAIIQVELRDIESGNKIVERFRTDEALESVSVEEKPFTFLYQEGDTISLMEPSTFEQLEVSRDLFGKSAAYLQGDACFVQDPHTSKRFGACRRQDDMAVKVQFYDNKPMSASVPIRVTCTVLEAQPHTKGQTASPQYKKVTLVNGLTVQVPAFIETGDEVIINTLDDSYLTRAKE